MGSFDAESSVVKVRRVAIALDDVVRLQADVHMELVLPIGEWLIEVRRAVRSASTLSAGVA